MVKDLDLCHFFSMLLSPQENHLQRLLKQNKIQKSQTIQKNCVKYKNPRITEVSFILVEGGGAIFGAVKYFTPILGAMEISRPVRVVMNLFWPSIGVMKVFIATGGILLQFHLSLVGAILAPNLRAMKVCRPIWKVMKNFRSFKGVIKPPCT